MRGITLGQHIPYIYLYPYSSMLFAKVYYEIIIVLLSLSLCRLQKAKVRARSMTESKPKSKAPTVEVTDKEVRTACPSLLQMYFRVA